jgi:hypothetical protein
MKPYRRCNPLPQPPANFGVQKQELENVVAKLSDHRTEQVTGRRLSTAETRRQKELRRVLREDHLRPISKIARAMLSDATGIEKALKMPPDAISSITLADEADGVRRAVEPYAPVFVENGLPEDFLTQLERATVAVRESLLGRAASVGRHIGAKKGLEKELKRGRRAVDLLDAMVTFAFKKNPDVVARWRAAKRVQETTGPTVGATGGTADENLPATPTTSAQVA